MASKKASKTKKVAPKKAAKRPLVKAAPKAASKKQKLAPSPAPVVEIVKEDNMVGLTMPSPETPSSDKKRAGSPSARWSTQNAAKRALARKFPFVDEKRMDAMRNSAGESPCQWVLNEMSKHKNHQEYLKSSFWVALEEEFDLSAASVFDALPPPESEQSFDEELFTAIRTSEANNPAERSPRLYIKFSLYAGVINETEFHGALKGSRIRKNVSAEHSHKMQVAMPTHKFESKMF